VSNISALMQNETCVCFICLVQSSYVNGAISGTHLHLSSGTVSVWTIGCTVPDLPPICPQSISGHFGLFVLQLFLKILSVAIILYANSKTAKSCKHVFHRDCLQKCLGYSENFWHLTYRRSFDNLTV
jgi:hypothetical protein